MVYGNDWIPLESPIYEPQKSTAHIVFDGRGRIDWHQTEGLLVVTREDVADDYIYQLEKKGIEYISAGKGKHIDLPLALHKLAMKGFKRLGLTGGSTLNGAFLSS